MKDNNIIPFSFQKPGIRKGKNDTIQEPSQIFKYKKNNRDEYTKCSKYVK